MQVDIKPFLIGVGDYSEFKQILASFRAGNINLVFEEVGFGGYFYYGVFWVKGDEEAVFNFIMNDKECLLILAREEN